LIEHQWPGNVRELANVMEHAYIIAGGQRITSEHLPHHIRQKSGPPITLSLKKAPENESGTMQATGTQQPRTLKEIEMEYILRVLDKHSGNKPAAAAELGIVLKTLYNKLDRWQEESERKAAG